MKKKIAIKATSFLGTSPNGAEPFTIDFFCEYLKEFGYEVEIIGSEVIPDKLKRHKSSNYLNYLHLPKIVRMFLHIPVSIINVYIYCKRKKPDLIMCTGGVFYNGLSIFIVGKILGIKHLVRTAEDHFNFYKFCSTLRSKIFHFLLNRQISKIVLKNADYVLTTGPKSKEFFVQKGVKENRIWGIPGKIDSNLFYKKQKPSLERINFSPDKKIILFVGALSGVKGADLLPEIIGKINSNSENFQFLIVGNENEYGSEIKKNIEKNNFANVIFLNSLPRDELIEIYSMCSLLIFLCRVGVGYGQVTIEATLCDLPVLSLNPGIDVEWWLKDKCCDSLDEMVSKILSEDYSVANFPTSFDEEFIKVEYKKLFNQILN